MKRYGWIPDLPDHRDHRFSLLRTGAAMPPPAVDLRPNCPPRFNQGQTSSCTGNSVAMLIWYERRKRGLPDFPPSRLFAYWNGRDLEGATDMDGGAMIRDVIKGVVTCGDVPESDWPFFPDMILVKPRQRIYDAALLYSRLMYQRVDQDLVDMRVCLAAGNPFVFGFTVYNSFEGDAVAATGEVPMPGPDEQALGGHAVMAIGYDDAAGRLCCVNSWGEEWGQQGFFTLPYEYVTDPNLADDFWTLSIVPPPPEPEPAPAPEPEPQPEPAPEPDHAAT